MDKIPSIRFWFLCAILLNAVRCQSKSNIKQLYSDVFSNYQKSIVPNSDFSSPLNITLTIYLVTIIRFQEVDQTLELTAGLGATWTDEDLTWTPSSYGNAQDIVVPVTDIWTPKFALVNSVETYEPLGGDNANFATINYTGGVNIFTADVLASKCTTNIYKFPFDSQTCYLIFNVVGMPVNIVTLNSVSDPVELSFFTPNSDWSLQSYKGETSNWNGYSIFTFTLTIQRAPLYYTVLVCVPTILFGLLNPLVFLLPVESGERIGLSITVLLSYAIFLSMVQTAIPATSNPMSLLLIIMIVTIAISGMILAVTIYISLLYNKDPQTKMNVLWRYIGTRRNTVTRVHPFTNDCEGEKTWTEISPSWKDVCDGLDTIVMVISYCVLFIINCAYFIAVLT
ncbi:acetylcholine receptor subunit alpha-1-B-like [Mytilus californianus]|uniref:acetylcholine receptor subunit alpha-1-B-like n=1 Tax=Mytilus californianus TaxID=6549 RepID=UPI0022456CE4|nr:acetylcholine receptor subunit alpha-1-B-like [Mytilus californianus]